jgi:type IV pilus assembly protein PilB
MDNKTFIDFEEAVRFLKTTPSTMYKWLQAGKVPGHKLGRQWRFIKEELENHVSGKGPQNQPQQEISELAQILNDRCNTSAVKVKSSSIGEELIWDAYEHGCRLIHISPLKGKFEIKYRDRKGLTGLAEIQESTFQSLDLAWRQNSAPTQGEDTRRMYLTKNHQALQIRYQKIETISGPRVTLRLWNPQEDILSLEKIADGHAETLKTLKIWSQKSFGLIVISGSLGSGKTTTYESLLKAKQILGAHVFTVENPVEILIEGIHQVELVRKNGEQFETAFHQIMNSDPDVIGIGLEHYEGLEKIMIEKAVAAASTGHLVLMQITASSCEDALAKIKKNSDFDVESVLVGISHQRLVPSGNRIKAQYRFLTPES